jgi:hypothetical protein
MQAMSWLSGNKAVAYGAAALALIVAALLVLLVFRLAFGRRLRMSGRGRQLRLGIVDAFDLDRQRQLVIVRRDNTEHLIMIGGPNDILIESQIVRAEAREGRQRDKDFRDREHREKDRVEPVQLPAAQPLKPAASEPQLPLPPFVPEAPAEESLAPSRPTPPVAPPSKPAPVPPLQPAARTPFSPLRRTPPHRPENKPAEPPLLSPDVPAVIPEPATPPPVQAEITPPPPKPLPPQPAMPSAASSFMRWRPGQTTTQPRPPGGPSFTQPVRPVEPSLAPAPPAPAPSPVMIEMESKPAAPEPPPPPVPPGTQENIAPLSDSPAAAVTQESPAPKAEPAPMPAAPRPPAEDLMLSLEEEMAKLLGRTADKP